MLITAFTTIASVLHRIQQITKRWFKATANEYIECRTMNTAPEKIRSESNNIWLEGSKYKEESRWRESTILTKLSSTEETEYISGRDLWYNDRTVHHW